MFFGSIWRMSRSCGRMRGLVLSAVRISRRTWMFWGLFVSGMLSNLRDDFRFGFVVEKRGGLWPMRGYCSTTCYRASLHTPFFLARTSHSPHPPSTAIYPDVKVSSTGLGRIRCAYLSQSNPSNIGPMRTIKVQLLFGLGCYPSHGS
jgi:hypothetical protein